MPSTRRGFRYAIAGPWRVPRTALPSGLADAMANLGRAEARRIGRVIVGLLLRIDLGRDAGVVVFDLASEGRGIPAQHRCDQLRYFAGDVDAAARGVHRHPQPPGQDVVQVQRALVGHRVVGFTLEVVRCSCQRLTQIRLLLNKFKQLHDRGAVPAE